MAAQENRSAASANGGISRRPTLMATKEKPHSATMARTSARSRATRWFFGLKATCRPSRGAGWRRSRAGAGCHRRQSRCAHSLLAGASCCEWRWLRPILSPVAWTTWPRLDRNIGAVGQSKQIGTRAGAGKIVRDWQTWRKDPPRRLRVTALRVLREIAGEHADKRVRLHVLAQRDVDRVP
jgi:hypothetical protein